MSISGVPLKSKLRSAARRVLKGPLDLNGHQYHGAFRGNHPHSGEHGSIADDKFVRVNVNTHRPDQVQ